MNTPTPTRTPVASPTYPLIRSTAIAGKRIMEGIEDDVSSVASASSTASKYKRRALPTTPSSFALTNNPLAPVSTPVDLTSLVVEESSTGVPVSTEASSSSPAAAVESDEVVLFEPSASKTAAAAAKKPGSKKRTSSKATSAAAAPATHAASAGEVVVPVATPLSCVAQLVSGHLLTVMKAGAEITESDVRMTISLGASPTYMYQMPLREAVDLQWLAPNECCGGANMQMIKKQLESFVKKAAAELVIRGEESFDSSFLEVCVVNPATKQEKLRFFPVKLENELMSVSFIVGRFSNMMARVANVVRSLEQTIERTPVYFGARGCVRKSENSREWIFHLVAMNNGIDDPADSTAAAAFAAATAAASSSSASSLFSNPAGLPSWAMHCKKPMPCEDGSFIVNRGISIPPGKYHVSWFIDENTLLRPASNTLSPSIMVGVDMNSARNGIVINQTISIRKEQTLELLANPVFLRQEQATSIPDHVNWFSLQLHGPLFSICRID